MGGQRLSLTVVAGKTIVPPMQSGRFKDDQIYNSERLLTIVLKIGFENVIAI
jgi:hypothetical protein